MIDDGQELEQMQAKLAEVYQEAITLAGGVEPLKRLTAPYEDRVTTFVLVEGLTFGAATQKLRRELGAVDRETAVLALIGCVDALLRMDEGH